MLCPQCKEQMTTTVEDLDYTKLSDLRGKTVVLLGVTVHRCAHCSGVLADIPRLASLHRELVAADMLRVGRLSARYADGEWTISLPVGATR